MYTRIDVLNTLIIALYLCIALGNSSSTHSTIYEFKLNDVIIF